MILVIASVILFISVFLGIISVFIFMSGDKQKETRYFAAWLMSMSAWGAISQILGSDLINVLNINLPTATLLVRFLYVAAICIALNYYLLSTAIWQKTKWTINYVKPAIISSALVSIAVLLYDPTLTLSSIEITQSGLDAEVYHRGYAIYSAVFLLMFITAFYNLYVKLQSSKLKDKGTKRLLRFVLYAFLPEAIIGVLFNLLLPLFTYDYIWIGPIFMVAYSFMLIYTLSKYQLFSIRRSATRSVGYTILIGAIAIFYFGSVAIFINQVQSTRVPFLTQMTFVAISVTVGIAFTPMRKAFNKWTDGLFFRDAYDTQDVVEKVTAVVTTKIDLDGITEQALYVLKASVRPEWAAMVIDPHNDSAEGSDEAVSANKPKVDKKLVVIGESVDAPVKTLRLLNKAESDFNLPTYGRTPKELQDFMLKKDIGFAQAMKTADRTVGYIVMGPKSSGSAYDMQDVKMLNITSGQLAVAIENSLRFESIKQFNVKLQKDIKDATRKLERTNKRLLEMDKTKDDFISIASHQLRTPLTSIKGYMSMLSEGMFGKVSKEQNKALTESIASSNRMVFLIADLLSTSRLRSGKFSVDASVFDIAKEVRNQSKQLEPLAKAKNIKLTTHLPRGGALINADQMKISQVLMNFMDNAIHYTQEGGQVDVHLSKKGRSIEFKVIDNGIGIPEKDQREIFGKFFRASNAQRFRPDGTGIGVFIARKIITLHKGDTIFKSKEGEGSTFGFKIPIGNISSKTRR